MIKQISRKNLDLDKYTACIVSSTNYRVYAEVWYLDVVADNNWYCLVLNDYEAVMPIPYQRKFGLKFVIQPYYCQQLGVFHGEQFTKKQFKQFEQKLHRKLVRSYHFNEENTEIFSPKGEKRTNYVLDLNRSYEEIYNNYSKSRRKEIRKSERFAINIKPTEHLTNLLKLKKNYNYTQENNIFKYYQTTLYKLVQNGEFLIFDLFDNQEKLIASQIFMVSKNRIYCTAFARDPRTENHNASTLIKDYIILQFATQDLLLDFEGSMQPNIAKFMKGFTPKEKKYTNYKNLNF